MLTPSDKMKYVHSDIRGPIFREAQRMRREGIDVLRLNTGNPATFGFTMPESVKTALLENTDKAVAYCEPQGMLEARQAICDYHRGLGVSDISPEDIYIGNGVSELVYLALTPLLSDGDEILVPCPCYSLWSNTTLLTGATPVYYTCDEKSNWYPDINDIRKKVNSRTKAILIINPNNPTGAVYPKEILEEMVQIARENNLVVFSDEIYDRLIMDGLEFTPVASLAEDLLCVTMNGLSKSHVICGFRCGWMVISGKRRNEAGAYLNGIFELAAMRLCSNALTQLVIPAALKDSESTRQMLIPGGRLYEQRAATMREIEKIDGLSCVKNSAAFYVFPKLDIKKFNITDDKKFTLDLLHEKHIFVVAGSGFEWPEPDHFRIVMLPEPDTLSKAVSDIGDFLKTYRQK